MEDSNYKKRLMNIRAMAVNNEITNKWNEKNDIKISSFSIKKLFDIVKEKNILINIGIISSIYDFFWLLFWVYYKFFKSR